MKALMKFIIESLKTKIEISIDENIELEFINGIEYDGQYKYDKIKALLLDYQLDTVKEINDSNFSGLHDNLLIFVAKIGGKLRYVVIVVDLFDIAHMPEIIDIIAV
ncbi:hypothetical protein ACXZ1K_11475 [Pedobacter sp. PWIIR3]